MSRKRRHGPPARHQQQHPVAPRHEVSPDARYVVRERVGGPSEASPATVVLRDGDGRPYVVLADGAGGAAYAQGAWQTQQAAAQSAQAMQVRSSSTGMTAGAAKPYPAMPQISDAKPLLRSLGATGTSIFSGIITSEEYNADFYWKDAIQIYEQMIRNDAQIFAVVQLLELPIRRATWSIEPGGDTPRDKEIAAFVETCLLHDQMRYATSEGRTLTQKWDDILRHILMMLRFGFMAFEVNWRLDDGWVKWARWTPLLPRTVWRWWVGEDNELVGIQQWTFKNYTYQFVDIPADKLLLFVHRQEGNNYEGVSILRSAYKHWYYKDNYYKIEAIDIERNAADIPAIYLPENFTQDDLNQAQTIMANMRVNEEMGVTMPPGWKIEYIRTYGRNTASIQPSIEHHDTMIARNVLGQFINLGSHEVGSYALASDQKATLLAALQAECEYIEDVINNDAIVRLVDYNFDGVEQYPRLKASKLIAQDLDVISTALNKLTSAPSGPLIHSDPELEDYLRDLYGLPKAPSGVVAGTNPTAPSTPERPETEAAQATAGNDHADAESKDAQPTARQQATSQAIANGAPGVSGRAAAGGAAVQTAEALRGPLREEARLLREALAAAVGADAVERGLQFFNPNHYPGGSRQGGQFAPRGGGGPGGGESEAREGKSGGPKGGAAKKSGGSAKGSGGSSGKAAANKGTKAEANHLPKSYAALSKMDEIAGPHGSQGGKWYRDKAGNEFYVKAAHSEAHAYNEAGAIKAYEVAGAKAGRDVPHVGVLHDAAGKAYVVSQRIPGTTQHNGSWWTSSAGASARAAAEQHFGTDALLAHWDVAGQGHDNLHVGAEGHAVRIEAGGAMGYRAMGGAKSSWKEGGAFNEPWTMRGQAHGGAHGNAQDGHIFGHMSDERAGELLTKAAGKLTSPKLEAAWQKLGMPKAQIQHNLAVIEARRAEVPKIAAELGYSKGGKGGSKGGSKTEPAAPAKALVDSHWEGHGTWVGYKGTKTVVDAHDGTAKVTVTDKHGHSVEHVVEPDHEYGGFKVTNTETGKVEHGLTNAQLNQHIKNGLGNGAASDAGFKMAAGSKVLTPEMLHAPGAKPSAAQKALNEEHEFKQKAKQFFEQKTAGGKAWEQHTSGTPGVEYHLANGEMVRVSRTEDDTHFKIERFHANPNAKATQAEILYGKMVYGAGHKFYPTESPYEANAYSTKTVAKSATVKSNLEKAGVTNEFMSTALATHHGGIHSSFGTMPTGASVPLPHVSAGSHYYGVGGHPMEGVGHYRVEAGTHRVEIKAEEGKGLTITHEGSGHASETRTVANAQEARNFLGERGMTTSELHTGHTGQFLDMAQHDYERYMGKPSAEQQVRIKATDTRRAELDQKYGTYSLEAARGKIQEIYQQYPGVKAAIQKHLSGGTGSHLGPSTIAKATHGGGTSAESKAAKLAAANDALGKLREVSEWSLLHSPSVTREGTIRLFHGTNGNSSHETWAERLTSGAYRRGTPFTTSWTIAKSFANHGKYGRTIISAQVPASAVNIWHGIRGTDTGFQSEEEYTIGTGKIGDFTFLKP